jgi:hypothetical protein
VGRAEGNKRVQRIFVWKPVKQLPHERSKWWKVTLWLISDRWAVRRGGECNWFRLVVRFGSGHARPSTHVYGYSLHCLCLMHWESLLLGVFNVRSFHMEHVVWVTICYSLNKTVIQTSRNINSSAPVSQLHSAQLFKCVSPQSLLKLPQLPYKTRRPQLWLASKDGSISLFKCFNAMWLLSWYSCRCQGRWSMLSVLNWDN